MCGGWVWKEEGDVLERKERVWLGWEMCCWRRLFVHVAARMGSERVVERVVERGGELEVKDEEGETLLFVACG